MNIYVGNLTYEASEADVRQVLKLLEKLLLLKSLQTNTPDNLVVLVLLRWQTKRCFDSY